MQIINTSDGLFRDGNPASGEPGTIVPAVWLNSMQTELQNLLGGLGGTADPSKNDQLKTLLAAALAQKATSASPTFTGQVTIPEGTKTSPGLTFANDGAPDTGFWHINDGSFGAVNNAIETARFTPTGVQLSGTPTAPTAAPGTNTPQLATMAALNTGLYTGKGIARFTANGSFTIPAGVTTVYVSGCAGGGGGGGSGSGSSSWMAAAGGGGAGQSVIRQPFTVTPGQKLTIVIGAGGAAGLGGPANSNGSQGNSGTAGGNTTITEVGLALIGGGGGGGSSTYPSVWGNTAGPGGGGGGYPYGSIGCSGPTISVCYPGGIGGSSPFGGGGSTSNWYWGGNVSTAGGAFGGGGGGGFASSVNNLGIAGANGAPGLILIEW